MLHRYHGWKGDWGRGTPASPCVPGRRRAPPSNESEERTPKAPSGEKPLALRELGDYEPVGATGLARLNLRARHTSGLALHFPRIKAIRRDKNVGFRRHP
jgi:hypothetical protein